MGTQQGGGRLQARKRTLLPETQSVHTLILAFPASRMVRNELLLYEPPSLWYFVLAPPSRLTDFGTYKRGAALTNA